jgi:hypothetical protein
MESGTVSIDLDTLTRGDAVLDRPEGALSVVLQRLFVDEGKVRVSYAGYVAQVERPT